MELTDILDGLSKASDPKFTQCFFKVDGKWAELTQLKINNKTNIVVFELTKYKDVDEPQIKG